MRLRQVLPIVSALPFVASWAPMALAGAAGLFLVGLGGPSAGGVVFKLRLSGALVAAASAWLLDDPAATTMASSPTPLLTRRGIRVAVVVAFVLGWFVVAVAIAELRVRDMPGPALIREVFVLTALAMLGSIAAQRWSSDGRGGSAGAFVAIWWFAMSFLPPMGALPLPPQALQPGTAGPLLVVACAALGLALLLSRDPAAGPLTVRSGRRG